MFQEEVVSGGLSLRKKSVILFSVLLVILLAGGCSGLRFPDLGERQEPPALIKVNITFRNGFTLDGYVRSLSPIEDSKALIGGATNTKVYDADGNITGAFNYNHVMFITIAGDEEQKDDGDPGLELGTNTPAANQ